MGAPPDRIATLAIRGPLQRTDLQGLFARTCALLDSSSAQTLRCEVSQLAIDAVTVEALARLALAARRRGCSVRLCGAHAELRELIDLMGLTEALGG